ncbi:MAG TPA: DUF4169 family protein [Rhizomicrobium sp.]|nr:DUF4169 family protein [Rhizomicrobium sp.]
MAEIVNLRRARKAKGRAEKEKAADANRVLHGTPKALKKLSAARKNKAEQHLTGHRLEGDRSVGESQSDQKPDDDQDR